MMTSAQPRRLSSQTRALPINPAPPVTRTRRPAQEFAFSPPGISLSCAQPYYTVPGFQPGARNAADVRHTTQVHTADCSLRGRRSEKRGPEESAAHCARNDRLRDGEGGRGKAQGFERERRLSD